MDLRDIGLYIEPNQTDSILPEIFSPVIIKFDTEVIKKEAEGILQINSDLGAVRGDVFWAGNDLHFVPVQGWTAGVRHTLSFIGTIRSVDGREKRVHQFISFYAINNNIPPVLVSHDPLNGESVGINNNIFEFNFSCSMDRLSVESALTIDGIGSKVFEWSDNDKTLKVISEKFLSPWNVYRWNLRDTAKCINGVPLPKTYSGYFTTDLDKILPQVVNVFPVLKTDGSWYPTGADIETGLGIGHGIAVKFNKPMGENVLRSIRIEPSLTGRSEYLGEDSIVYIFSRDPEPETTYTLIISGDARDNDGLKIGTDYRLNFTPDIPFLKVMSVMVNGNTIEINSANSTLDKNIVIPVNITPGNGQLTFSIYFSLLIDFEEKINIPQRISFNPFFPRTLPPVALFYLDWISDDRLLLYWEGLTAGDIHTPHYYKLTIPGGRGGISSESGIFMKEDLIIFLEAIYEK
jgi:hypothetical protein